MASYEKGHVDPELGVQVPAFSQQEQTSEAGFAQKIHAHIRPLEIGIATVAVVNACLCGTAIALYNKQSLLMNPTLSSNPFLTVGQLILSMIVFVGCIVALTSKVRGSPPIRLMGSIIVIGANIYMTYCDGSFLNKKTDSDKPVDPVSCQALSDAVQASGQTGFAATNLCTLETAIQVLGVIWSLGLLVECVIMFEHHRRRSGATQTENDSTVAQDMRVGFFLENGLPTSRLEQYYGKNYEAVMNGNVTIQVPSSAPQVQHLKQQQQQQQQRQTPQKLSLNNYVRHGAPPSGTSTTIMN